VRAAVQGRGVRHHLRDRHQPGGRPDRPGGSSSRSSASRGAWYTYEGDQLGQGKENSRNFLRDNPDLANEIEKKIKEKLGVGPAHRRGSRSGRRGRHQRVGARWSGSRWSGGRWSGGRRPRGGCPGGPGRRPAVRPRAGARVRRLVWAAVPDRPGTRPRAVSRPAARAGTGPEARARPGEADDGHEMDSAEQARQLCLRLLTGRPRTRAQLAEAMHRRGVPEGRGRHGPGPLHRGGPDRRRCVRPRLGRVQGTTAGGLARRALSAELKQRGVDGEDISAAVSALDLADEIDTARRLVAKGLAASRGKPLPTRVRRLVGLLARKGYPAPIAYRVVREALDQEGADAAAAGIDLDDTALTIADADADLA